MQNHYTIKIHMKSEFYNEMECNESSSTSFSFIIITIFTIKIHLKSEYNDEMQGPVQGQFGMSRSRPRAEAFVELAKVHHYYDFSGNGNGLLSGPTFTVTLSMC